MSLVKIGVCNRTTHSLDPINLAFAVCGHYGFHLDTNTYVIYDSQGELLSDSIYSLAQVMSNLQWLQTNGVSAIVWTNMPHDDVTASQILMAYCHSNAPEDEVPSRKKVR